MLPLDNPTLRPLDVRRVRHRGEPCFLLRDPLKIAEQHLYVSEQYGPILAMFDGQLTVDGIVQAIEESYHFRVEPEFIQALVDALDDALMLDSPRFRERSAAALEEYRSAPFRPPALAGLGYPEQPQELWSLFQAYLEERDAIVPAEVDWSRGVGLLSPHIDYERGGEIYAGVWKRAARAAAEAEVVVIFGTDHQSNDPFTLTRQHYATPYGILPTAQTVVEALATAIGEEAAFDGELRHRGEHSLELVLTWLHHLRGGKPVEVVPILCGSLNRFMLNGDSPRDDDLLDRVLASLRETTQGRRVLVVASGDLAHVGPAFGQGPLTDEPLRELEEADARIVDRMAGGNAEGFFAEIKRVQNRNNICGVTPIYLTMRLLDALPGEAVSYRVCPADEPATSVVTVAGVLFHAGATGSLQD